MYCIGKKIENLTSCTEGTLQNKDVGTHASKERAIGIIPGHRQFRVSGVGANLEPVYDSKLDTVRGIVSNNHHVSSGAAGPFICSASEIINVMAYVSKFVTHHRQPCP